MSNNKDNLKPKVSVNQTTANNAASSQNGVLQTNNVSAIEVAKTGTFKDVLLWILAMAAFIAATLVNTYLPGYWQQANNIWVRIAIIIGLVVFAFVCLYFTNQGKAFKTLLSDAGVELRRVTWPLKNETIKWTWQSLVVMFLIGLLVWLLDTVFNQVVGIFIG